MISEAEAQRAEQWVAEAVRDGATVVHGGGETARSSNRPSSPDRGPT